MEVLVRCQQLTATTHVSTSLLNLHNTRKIKRNIVCQVKPHRKDIVNDDDNDNADDQIFSAALGRASIRFQETLRSEPLLLDPYVGCLTHSSVHKETCRGLHWHSIATKFIDDKLLETIEKTDGLRQVVSFTDGMDTRPYRLKWPPSTLMYDVSPERIFTRSIRKLRDVGARVPRGCMFSHIPSETLDVERVLRSKGYNGARPGIWVFQDFPVTTVADFKRVLSILSNLAMKGSLFLGEFPVWLAEADIGIELTEAAWVENLFMSHGLRAKVVEYEEVARKLGVETTVRDYSNRLFLAEQLQFSDDQMEVWRKEFQRIEEEGDEEGFEEL